MLKRKTQYSLYSVGIACRVAEPNASLKILYICAFLRHDCPQYQLCYLETILLFHLVFLHIFFRMPFGWYRAEVIGALTSVLLIWVVTGVLVYMAVQRVIYKEFEIDATVMLITSAVGVAVNLV